eukprot:4727422-Pyramimonas_sp.AAC.1
MSPLPPSSSRGPTAYPFGGPESDESPAFLQSMDTFKQRPNNLKAASRASPAGGGRWGRTETSSPNRRQVVENHLVAKPHAH